MKKQSLAMAALALAAAPAFGQVYDNGGMDPQAGGCAGGQYSAIELPSSIFGNNTIVTSFHQADDFTVPGGQSWSPTELTWYLYQSFSTPQEPITAVFIQLWRGSQADMLAGTATLVGGDMTTNRKTNQTFSNIYRVSSATPTNCDRAIKEVKADMTWAGSLPAGQYWIEVGSTGNVGFSGPWANHVVPRDGTENSIFYTVSTGAWAINANTDGVTKWDYPFKLAYTTSGGNCSDFAITQGGSCPGPMTISWSGAPVGATKRVIYTSSGGSGGVIPPGNACAGTTICIGLAGVTLHPNSLPGTANGTSPSFNAPCGLRVQLITQGGCDVSNALVLQ